MPNTLAHLGLHAIGTRSLIRQAEMKWIWAACVIPDLPWIMQRVVRATGADVSLYELRVYAIAQASLLLCLVFSAALSLWATRPLRVFAILSLGCILHLLADSLQTKWANGVHFFAPISWELVGFYLFWPEDLVTWILVAMGVGIFVFAWVTQREGADDLVWPGSPRLLLSAALLTIYLALPFAIMSGVRAADNHYVETLKQVQSRPGKPIAFDRTRIEVKGDTATLVIWTGERLRATGPVPSESGNFSVKGVFETPSTVRVTDLHRHPDSVREFAALIGLLAIAAWWLSCFLHGRRG